MLADEGSIGWGFWDRWASGEWEPETHAAIDSIVDGGTYVDIGAWVGPTVLWAAPLAERVVAVEADPAALTMLAANLDGLTNVDIVAVAIAEYDGTTTIGVGGDSMSRTGEGDHTVRCVTLPTLWAEQTITDVALVKIDVEGAEREIIPAAADFLHDVGAPVLISTHPWAPFDIAAALDGWDLTRLSEWEWLVTPC
jgi:FkbM family methyltransferase